MAEAIIVSRHAEEPGYHGNLEGLSLFYSALAGLCGLALFCIPWLDLFVTSRTHPHPRPTSHAVVGALSANVVCLVMVATYVGLYRGLSSRIASGGTDMVYLDKVRKDIATFASGVSFLALMLWLNGVLSLGH